MKTRRLTMLTITGLFLVVTMWTGCGNAEEHEPEATPPQTEPTSVAPTSPPPSEMPATAPAASHKTVEIALAVEEHESRGVEVSLLRVRRVSGETLNVHWRYSNGTQEEKTLFSGMSSWYTPYRLAADTYIIDHVNQKKHLVVKAKDLPVTSKTTHDYGELKLNAGDILNAWAKFPAPPSDVETISVYIPGVPPFEDVPISN